MTVIGYARVSTLDQDLSIQEAALKAAGADIIRSEKRSGASTVGRFELETILRFLRPGDTLLVTRIDRLARSIADLSDIVRTIKAKGASLMATEQPFNTGDIYGELTVNLLGCFAQFEMAIRLERQLEGIAKAKAEGVYKGRKRSVDIDAVRSLKADGVGPAAIAKRLGVARASVYRALAKA
jgi:DNA invertase Pin-like site-specific DNA recombinase